MNRKDKPVEPRPAEDKEPEPAPQKTQSSDKARDEALQCAHVGQFDFGLIRRD